jgi:hypothetical protein
LQHPLRRRQLRWRNGYLKRLFGYTLSEEKTNFKLLVFSGGIALILVVPLGVIEAITNNHINLNVISELVGGFVVPGNAIAMNMFKSYGCMVLYNAILFSGDLKLAHYVKIPPRSMFRVQIASTFLSVIAVLQSDARQSALNIRPSL